MTAHNPAECLTCRAGEDEKERIEHDVADMQRRVERLRMISVSRRLQDVRDITGETA